MFSTEHAAKIRFFRCWMLPGRQAKGKGKGPFGKMPFGFGPGDGPAAAKLGRNQTEASQLISHAIQKDQKTVAF